MQLHSWSTIQPSCAADGVGMNFATEKPRHGRVTLFTESDRSHTLHVP
jgi:hypothetical protein